MDLRELERELEYRDSFENGMPWAEIMFGGLVLLEVLALSIAAVCLWW